jgi:hypothetical protein
VLAAFAQLERASGHREFRLRHVVAHILTQTSTWQESTLRTHIANHMCVDAPEHMHADLERVCRGSYRRLERGGPTLHPARQASEPNLVPTGEALMIALEARWLFAGDITLVGEQLTCPTLPTSPGVYRLTISPPDAQPDERFVGETDNLRRRVNQYRRPGVSQLANTKLNKQMIRRLGRGGRVEVHIITEATAGAAGGDQPLDLGRKEIRRLIENLALATTDVVALSR